MISVTRSASAIFTASTEPVENSAWQASVRIAHRFLVQSSMDAKAKPAKRPPASCAAGDEKAYFPSFRLAPSFGLTGAPAAFKYLCCAADLKPAGRYVAKDLFHISIVPMLMKRRSARGVAHCDCGAATGFEMGEDRRHIASKRECAAMMWSHETASPSGSRKTCSPKKRPIRTSRFFRVRHFAAIANGVHRSEEEIRKRRPPGRFGTHGCRPPCAWRPGKACHAGI